MPGGWARKRKKRKKFTKAVDGQSMAWWSVYTEGDKHQGLMAIINLRMFSTFDFFEKFNRIKKKGEIYLLF